MDKYLALLQSTPQSQRATMRFLPAWRARRSEIEVLADRAASQHAAAMRIGVVHDTTAFKCAFILRNRVPAATEHGFDTRLRQVLLLQLARRGFPYEIACPERVAGLLMEYSDVPLPWHTEQPHLAEWQAFSTREILFHLDQTVDARNMAQAQARQRAAQLTKDDTDDAGSEMATCTRHIVVEDLGGAPAYLDEDAHPESLGDEKHELHLPVEIWCVLSRVAERAAAGRPGRPRDAHKQMFNVAKTFSAVLDGVHDPFPTQQQDNGGMGADIHAALGYQADVAERLRQQQDPREPRQRRRGRRRR